MIKGMLYSLLTRKLKFSNNYLPENINFDIIIFPKNLATLANTFSFLYSTKLKKTGLYHAVFVEYLLLSEFQIAKTIAFSMGLLSLFYKASY